MGIENILKYIDVITMMLPLIEKIVALIEGLFGKLGKGQGAAKKEAVTEIVKASMVGSGVDLPKEVLGGLIDSVVKVKNTTGEFIHTPPEVLGGY